LACSIALLACDGSPLPSGSASGGAGGARGAAGAGGGAGGGGAGGAGGRDCGAGQARCNGLLAREVCGNDGRWVKTSFVCARTVAVDDETGSYCVTKGDGSYRCWGAMAGATPAELPTGSYVRVQAAREGLVGLTEAGRIVTTGFPYADGLPPVATFRATNMFGFQAICPLFRDGTFGVSRDGVDDMGVRRATFTPVAGTFVRALCAYEGLLAAVQTDGLALEMVPPGDRWRDVALSMSILCGLDDAGAITCVSAPLSCGKIDVSDCSGARSVLPAFPGQGYRSITATSSAACALDQRGALVCQRYDGTPMLADAGPYTFAEGGHTVVCAIRIDGSVACFRHGGGSPLVSSDPGQFAPVDPPIDAGW